jgi:N-acetyl-anhydromuramyl-L-alanine amidase AmpD
VKFKAPAPPYLGPAAHTSSGANKPISRIVMHSTVSPCKPGGAQAIARYFRSKAAGGSAHYVVDPTGAVQVVYDDTIAWHAPPNPHSIGVELCDMPGSDEAHKASVKRWNDKNHSAMLDHAAELVAGLCLAYDVPIRKIGPGQLKAGQHGICGHVDVSTAWHQSTHWDPGHFPWADFIAAVQAKADAMKGEKPEPKPGPTPAPAPKPTPAPAPRPKLERDTLDGARTIEHRAAKHGNKHRASKWRSILDAMLGRKS